MEITKDNSLKERLEKFNQYVQILAPCQISDTLLLTDAEAEVEYCGSDDFVRGDNLLVFWRFYDWHLVSTIPHIQDDKRVILEVMEIAERAHYGREKFIELMNETYSPEGQPEKRPPTKHEVEIVLNKILLLAKSGNAQAVEGFTEKIINKWDLENWPDNRPDMQLHEIQPAIDVAVGQLVEIEWHG